MASAAGAARTIQLGHDAMVPHDEESAAHSDPFADIRAFMPPVFPGLPETVDVFETAARAKFAVNRGAAFPSMKKKSVDIPVYFSSQEASQLVAEDMKSFRSMAPVPRPFLLRFC
jgi:hypothetical protein